MTTITSTGGAFRPPVQSAPPTSPVPTNPDGTPKETEVIIVIGERKPLPPQTYGPYGTLTGAEENSRRDAEWASSHPAARSLAKGNSPFNAAYLNLNLTEADTNLDPDPIGTYFSSPVVSPVLANVGIANFDLSKNKATHIENNHFNTIDGKSQFAPERRSHEALVANVIVPVLQNPYAIQFLYERRNSNGQIEVNVWGNLPGIAGTDTQGSSTRSVKVSMWWTPGSATMQVKNAFPVTQGRGQ
jgi:hypothetical protein